MNKSVKIAAVTGAVGFLYLTKDDIAVRLFRGEKPNIDGSMIMPLTLAMAPAVALTVMKK